MKSRLFVVLQKIGRCFMLPIAILPIAGLFLGIGSSLSNPTTISTLHLEQFLGTGTFLHDLLIIMTKVGSAIFTNLPLIFATSVALGMAKKEKEVAALSAVIAFIVMHTAINGMLLANAQIIGNQVASGVLEGTITSICGIQSLEMGVFGGIIVGFGVSSLHNRFYRIELPGMLSFFEGTRFVPIISAIVFLMVGLMMYYIWPLLQNIIFSLGGMIAESGYAGTFIYGCIERLLVPFGLHHVFYLPFWQTAIGGTMEVSGTMVFGGQNIFFAQLADPSTIHFSADATRYLTGKYLLMMFALPGAALAMYHRAEDKQKKVAGSLLLSAALTCLLTGITEPLEFAFLFVAPLLFGVEVIFAGLAFMVAQICNITIGLTFSGGLIDFLVFGVLQGNTKTNWLSIIPIGIIFFLLSYCCFIFLIKRYDLKTIGRGEEADLLVMHKHHTKESINKADRLPSYIIDEQAARIVFGLGGRDNLSDFDSCITRLRLSLHDANKVQESVLKQAGAAAIMKQGNGVQIIFGPKASNIKTNLEEYLANTTMEDDLQEQSFEINKLGELKFANLVDGCICSIEASCDQMFAHKLLGDGLMIQPRDGLIVAPCDAVITMIYPTKHAIGLRLNNGCEVLLHVGIDTVHLNGEGFDLFVHVDQQVKKGDLLWNVDLSYIKQHAASEYIMVVFTKLTKGCKLEKIYGDLKRGDTMIRIIGG